MKREYLWDYSLNKRGVIKLENRYKVIVDFKQRSLFNMNFVQNNIDTAVIEFTIVDGGQVVPITGQVISIAFLKQDKTIVIQDISSGVSILEGGTTGKIQAILKSNTLSSPGIVKGEISFSLAGKKLSTATFVFTVSDSIDNGAGLLSTNEIPLLDAKILEATNKIAEINVIKSDYVASDLGSLNARMDTSDALAVSYKAETTQLNALSIIKYGGVENTDITAILNSFVGDIIVNLMNGKFIVSGVVTLPPGLVLKNGTLTITGNGMIVMSEESKIKDVIFIGNAMTNQAAVKVIGGHTRLDDLIFDKVTTAIRVDASVGGFYDVKMNKINIKSCDTGFYISAYGGWLTDIGILNAYIYFYEFGIYMTRGAFADMSAKSQFSQCNIDNITFVDWHQTNEGVGIYLNAGWNNFSNLVFFYDGNKAYPFYPIKFDEETADNSVWDTVYGLRSNSFINLTVEGYISKAAFYLNNFKNLKIVNNFALNYPLGTENNTMAQTVALGNIDTKIESLSTLTPTTNYIKIGAYPTLTFTREDKSIVITNTGIEVFVILAIIIDPIIKAEMLKPNRSKIMTQVLIEDGNTVMVANDYTHSIITINEGTSIPVSTVLDLTYSGGVITTKGMISDGCFFLTEINKTAIATSPDSIALRVRVKVKANSVIKIKGLRLFPYITTALNPTNTSWQNDYL